VSLTIRDARADDASAILALMRALAEYEKLLHLFHNTEERIREALFAPAARVFCMIGEIGAKPAGFGKAFMRRLAQRCAAEGLSRLEWSVLDWNAPSIAFYESLGAKPQGGWTTYRLADDALARLSAGPG
jgi:L-amino acid N-acyltransferase YncA